MAKTPMGLGQFSGKVGGVIFAVYNGEQIVRQYQPKVSNPKSSGQQLQRAKGNLVGRISQIVPYQILQGMGSNRRERRANFLRKALNLASASPVADNLRNVSATLLDENFIFSQGAVLPTIGATAATATANAVSVSLSKLTGVTDADFNVSGALVVVVLKSTDGRYESVLYEFVGADEFENNQKTLTFSHLSEGAYRAVVYIAPFKTTDGSSLRTRTEQLMGDATSLNALLVNNPSAIPLEWGESIMQVRTIFTPAGRTADSEKDDEEEEKPLSKSKKK
jgi:hypothetical protein